MSNDRFITPGENYNARSQRENDHVLLCLLYEGRTMVKRCGQVSIDHSIG